MFTRPTAREDPDETKVAVSYPSQSLFLPVLHLLSVITLFPKEVANILNVDLPLGFRARMSSCSVTRAIEG